MTPGEVIRGVYVNVKGNGAQAHLIMRWISAYDANKAILKTSGTDTQCDTFTVPEGVAYIRVSYSKNTYGTTVMIEANPNGWSAYEPYGVDTETVLASDVLVPDAQLERAAPEICLPPVLYVAVGARSRSTTIWPVLRRTAITSAGCAVWATASGESTASPEQRQWRGRATR